MRTYKKPVVSVDAGMTEGVYAASGAAQGTLNVTYIGVWDKWGTNGGKGLAMANWSGIDGTITLNVHFNDTVSGRDRRCICTGIMFRKNCYFCICKHSNKSADDGYPSEPWNKH